jgi:hypothetical protein
MVNKKRSRLIVEEREKEGEKEGERERLDTEKE